MPYRVDICTKTQVSLAAFNLKPMLLAQSQTIEEGTAKKYSGSKGSVHNLVFKFFCNTILLGHCGESVGMHSILVFPPDIKLSREKLLVELSCDLLGKIASD